MTGSANCACTEFNEEYTAAILGWVAEQALGLGPEADNEGGGKIVDTDGVNPEDCRRSKGADIPKARKVELQAQPHPNRPLLFREYLHFNGKEQTPSPLCMGGYGGPQMAVCLVWTINVAPCLGRQPRTVGIRPPQKMW